MFPPSQYYPDNELRVEADLEPWEGNDNGWMQRYSSCDKGNAVLVNLDGWTTIWAPDCIYNPSDFQLEEGFPIFEYYPGKMASGEDFGTINAFKRFYSNENRHMFEVGKTVTRTYIMRPPAEGPIEASYAVYAHWDEPLVIPVTDPAVDFGPEANSPMPYEFWVTQDTVIDPDMHPHDQATHIHWHIKTWDIDYTYWMGSQCDLLYQKNLGGNIFIHPSGDPDDYFLKDFDTWAYTKLPDAYPGEWTYLFKLEIRDPEKPWWPIPLGTDWYIAKIEIGELDGEW